MKDGDFLTITNRLEDIPDWFSLHPTEICSSFVHRMRGKVEMGQYPEEPIDGPNIWRPKTGDRFVWLRKFNNAPVKSIIAFRESALAIGENVRTQSMDDLMSYGELTKSEQSEEEILMARQAVELIKKLGIPREYVPEWKLGS